MLFCRIASHTSPLLTPNVTSWVHSNHHFSDHAMRSAAPLFVLAMPVRIGDAMRSAASLFWLVVLNLLQAPMKWVRLEELISAAFAKDGPLKLPVTCVVM